MSPQESMPPRLPRGLNRRAFLMGLMGAVLLSGDKECIPNYVRPDYPPEVEMLRPAAREVLLRLGTTAVQDYTYSAELKSGQRIAFEIVPPKDTTQDGEAVIFAPAEYANGHSASAIVRAVVARTLAGLDHCPIVILNNNSSPLNNYLNFTDDERRQLASGEAGPYILRAETALATAMRGRKATPVHALGMSLGATTASTWALETQFPLQSIGLIEPPHLFGRDLITDVLPSFYKSGQTLGQTFADSMQGVSITGMEQAGSTLDFAKAALLDPDNRASGYFMRGTNLAAVIPRLATLRPDTGMVVAWGSRSDISLPKVNQTMLKHEPFPSDEHAEGLEILGANHDVINYWPLVAYVLRRAVALAA